MKRRSSSHSMALVSALTFLSRVVGFFRVGIVAAIFGGGGKADVLNLLFSFPNNLRKLLAEGAFSAGFIPLIAQSDAANEDTRYHVRSILTVHMGVIGIISLACVLGAPFFVPLLFRFTTSQDASTIAIFRIFILYIPLTGLSAIAMAVLHTRHDFLLSALAPISFSLVLIACLVLFHRSLGLYSMPVGVVAGGIVQFLIQIPRVRKHHFSLLPVFHVEKALLSRFWKHVHTPLFIALLFTVMQQVSITLASTLPEGSGSAFTNALVIWQLPQGIFTNAVVTVVFPLISKYSAHKEETQLSDTLSQGIRQLIVLLIPSAVLLIVFSKEVVAVILQRGAFDAEAALRTARVLAIFSYGLLSVSAFTFFQRVSYAMSRGRLAKAITGGVVAVDIVLSVILIRSALGVAGLGLAQAISFSAGSGVFFLRLNHSLPSLRVMPIVKSFFHVLGITMLASSVLFLMPRVVGPWWVEGSSLRGWLLTGATLCLYSVVVLALYRVSGISILSPKK